MIGVSKKNCNFYVNKEARVIVCVIPDVKTTFTDYISKLVWCDYDTYLPVPRYDTLNLPVNIVGKATCHEDDEWDEEFGRELAYQRARDKYYRCFARMKDQYVDFIVGQLVHVVKQFDIIMQKANYTCE